jgi:hypothetical protein
MLTKAEVCQNHYGVQDIRTALPLYIKDGMTDIHSRSHIPLSSFTKLKLRYEAPSLPELPTMEQIDKGMKDHRLTDTTFGTFPVCRIGIIIIKIAHKELILQEAEDILFLQKDTPVRAPKLYAVFSRTEDFA